MFTGTFKTPRLKTSSVSRSYADLAQVWGANAVNGVINIITKNTSDTQGALVSVAGGNEDRATVTARYGGSLDDDAHWRIYGKYLDRASEETPSGVDANDAWYEWRAGFRIDWDPNSQGDTFTLQGDVYGSDDGDLRSVPLLMPPSAEVEDESVSASGANLNGHWSHEFGDDLRLTVESYIDLTNVARSHSRTNALPWMRSDTSSPLQGTGKTDGRRPISL